jgi:hypothetical protein
MIQIVLIPVGVMQTVDMPSKIGSSRRDSGVFVIASTSA